MSHRKITTKEDPILFLSLELATSPTLHSYYRQKVSVPVTQRKERLRDTTLRQEAIMPVLADGG